MLNHQTILKTFERQFGHTNCKLYTAPGRINLIGEHTDYNGGFVMPAAIDKCISVAICKNDTDIIRVYSMNYKKLVAMDINLPKPAELWACYIYGVVSEMKARGADTQGFDCVFGGDIPLGAGISSSAALESAFGFALNDLFKFGFSRANLAKIGQMTEHNYIGVLCGIMDQFASLFGKVDHVICLDCRSLKYKRFIFNPRGYKIVLIDTMVKHSLASSQYNVRRAQCEEGVSIISKDHPEVKLLRDVSPKMIESYKSKLDPIVFKRCSYVVYENERLLNACKDLDKGDIKAFGKKMFETHDGLSRNFGVSCEELDFIANIAKENDAVIGARMMGGGYGGCVISLVKTGAYKDYIDSVKKAYSEKFGKDPRVINVVISDGAKKWNISKIKK